MQTRTFEEVWQDIKKLEGTCVYTLCNHTKNHIKKVNEKELIRYSNGGRGSSKPVNKSVFERAWNDLNEKGCCKIGDSWAIACACLALLPEIEYSKNTRTIYLSENRHEFKVLVEKIL